MMLITSVGRTRCVIGQHILRLTCWHMADYTGTLRRCGQTLTGDSLVCEALRCGTLLLRSTPRWRRCAVIGVCRCANQATSPVPPANAMRRRWTVSGRLEFVRTCDTRDPIWPAVIYAVRAEATQTPSWPSCSRAGWTYRTHSYSSGTICPSRIKLNIYTARHDTSAACSPRHAKEQLYSLNSVVDASVRLVPRHKAH